MDHKKKALLFPKEHGSWALTFEPLLLALLVAPSLNGLILLMGSTLAFFAHPSAKALLASKLKNKTAWFFFLGFALPAVLFLALFVYLSSYPVYLSLLLALLLMILYLLLEAFSLERELLTELMASVAMGLIALSVVAAGGMSGDKRWAFLALLYSRSLMTTLYIHYRLLLLKNRLRSVRMNNFLHGIDFLLIVFLWSRHLLPFLGVAAVFILTLRAWRGVSSAATRTTVRKLGFQEVYYGLIFLVLTLAGYWLGI